MVYDKKQEKNVFEILEEKNNRKQTERETYFAILPIDKWIIVASNVILLTNTLNVRMFTN